MQKIPKKRRLRTPKALRRNLSQRNGKSNANAVITDPVLLAKKLKREKLLTMLSVASLIAVVLAVLVGFTLGMWRSGILSLPSPIEKLLGASTDTDDDKHMSSDVSPLLELLEGAKDISAEGLIIPEDEYVALIADSKPLNEYSAVIGVTIEGDGVVSNRRHHIWRMGEKYRAETYDNATGELVGVIVCDGKRIAVTDSSGSSETVKRIFPNTGSFTLENQIGIPSVTDFLYRDDVENLVIRIIRNSSDNLYYVTYNYIGHSQVEELYISLEHRLILRATSYALTTSGDSKKVYSLDTLSLADGDISSYGNPDLLFAID